MDSTYIPVPTYQYLVPMYILCRYVIVVSYGNSLIIAPIAIIENPPSRRVLVASGHKYLWTPPSHVFAYITGLWYLHHSPFSQPGLRLQGCLFANYLYLAYLPPPAAYL